MKNMKKGFTIIEMVIVIAIIGILAAVLIPTYGNVVANANESAALQTARSTMTNWLASSTTSAGVPSSGTDTNGNQFYAAYFEYSNDSGTTYQFRYTSGGVERTDDNASYYVNFANLPHASDVYLTTPMTDSKLDSTYKVTIYKQTVGTTTTSTNYYIKQGAKSAYTCGGADVYAATSATQVFYVCQNVPADLTGYTWTADTSTGNVTGTKTGVDGSVTFTKHDVATYGDWTEGSSDNSSQQSGEYTISFDLNGLSPSGYTKPENMTTEDHKITLPQIDIGGYKYYTTAACVTEATSDDTYTANTTLYLGANPQLALNNNNNIEGVTLTKKGNNTWTVTYQNQNDTTYVLTYNDYGPKTTDIVVSNGTGSVDVTMSNNSGSITSIVQKNPS